MQSKRANHRLVSWLLLSSLHTAPSLAGHGILENSGNAPEAGGIGHGWVKGDTCHQVDADTFCAYTNPAFGDGFGLSLVTTAATLAQLLASSPALAGRPAEKRPWIKTPDQPYVEASIEGKGVGLVANRTVATGELILARTPAVMVDDRAFRGLAKDALAALLSRAVAELPRGHQTRYLDLTTHSEVDSHRERVYQIFAKNNYRIKVANVTEFHATFVDVSRLNHDCRPGAGYHFDSTTLSQKILASRDVPEGAELTVSYTDPLQTRAVRQSQLQGHWGFTCTCAHCTADEDAVAESDRRIEEIHRLWKDLDDYTPASTASPEKAEYLITLYELEGVRTRIHEAYYRAAIEYNGIGDAANAAKYAILSIVRGQDMAGPDRPFVKNMREMAGNFSGHWSWNFRLANSTQEQSGQGSAPSGRDEL